MSAAPRLVQVVPLSPVEGPFTYAVPPALDADAVPGARVVVPFGRRVLTGVVVPGEPDPAAAAKAKPLLDVLDARPALTPELLGLTRWVADYYQCSWGEAVKAALPSGTEVESRRVATALVAPEAWPDADGRAVLQALADAGGALKTAALAEALGRSSAPQALLRRLEAGGAITVAQELQAARARPRVELHLRLADGVDGSAADGLRGERQRALVAHLAAADAPVRQAEALRASGASSSAVKGLVARGLVVAEPAEVERAADGMARAPLPPAADLALHPSQRAALGAIAGAIDGGEAATFLLRGVTGSGKTEVYLRALRAARARGQSAIVLVPEIALTPQTVRRFRAHFGDAVAVLHSRMSPGERLDAWTRIRDGRYPIVIGPRSAVFAPVERLGLIVVDEEHESSYKQFDPAPRYHARDVAVLRAHRAGAACVLGSATPSLESVANAAAGKYVRLDMPERVPVARPDGTRAPAPLPPVRIVDLAREREIRRLKGALSDPLRTALQGRLDRGEQAILLLNRRGYAPVLTCDACGHTPQCRDCDVSLTLHRTNHTLRCHYCGRAEREPRRCPNCGQDELSLLGSGTQRVEEELAEVLPEARVLRMDLDTTGRRGAHRRLLERFGRGDADVLLGTQMVAKGLDFPRVTLVGVVNADTGMLLPDFRASERTFQLLSQVAGRAGRHDLPGEVLIQTRNPEHPALRFAAAHDTAGFVAHEMAERCETAFPPYARLVTVEAKGPYERSTHALARQFADALRLEAGRLPGAEVLGPVAASVTKVKGFWRVHVHLRSPRTLPTQALTGAVGAALGAIKAPPRGHRLNVDVDPVGLF